MKKKRLRVVLPWVILAVYWPLLFVCTHIPRVPNLHIYGRDITLHFTAYMILTILFWLARYGGQRPSLRKANLYMVTLMLALYAILDELTQSLVGRHCDFGDWLSDVCGCVAGLALLFFLRQWIYALALYWVGLLTLTHWPGPGQTFVRFSESLEKFQVAYMIVAYLILTLLWWRSLCQGQFVITKKILFATIAVLPAYALLDETLSSLMGRGFDHSDFFSALAGIAVGIACAAALSQHNRISKSVEQ